MRHLSIPQYKGLSIEEILKKAQTFPETEQYLPDVQDFKKLPRQWLINLSYTLVGEPFSTWAR